VLDGAGNLTASVVREASYRFRACFRERWGGYVVLLLLIGVVGGVAMAAVTGLVARSLRFRFT
jgi:hypothetical protein